MPQERSTPGTVVEAEQQLCPHFGACGGCETQDVAYDKQVEGKQLYLQGLFSDLWDEEIPVLPSPAVWHYRNKVDFNFGLKYYEEPPQEPVERETLVGFTVRGQWYNPIDVEHCLIAPEGCDALLASVRAWYRREGLRAFNSRSKEGFLRTLLVREGTRTGQRMVALFTSPGDFDREGFVEAVQSAFPAESIYRGIFTRSARGAFADEMDLLHGSEYIYEELHVPENGGTRDLKFRISPFSFFQTNTLAAEVLYGEIRRWVRESGADILYDLFGGAGGIAFSNSDLVELVRSVESEESATEDGRHNAELNQMENVFFTNAKMRNYLLQLSQSGGMEPNSAVVVDPPRGGLTPKPIKRLLECAPPRILYVSCKAPVLRDELPPFLKDYRIERLWAVDMFPHTTHVETLASLVRR